MFAPEFGGPGEQLVGGRNGWAAIEVRIEGAQQRVLAAGGRGEVRCAVDDSIVGDEHRLTVGPLADTKVRRVTALAGLTVLLRNGLASFGPAWCHGGWG